MKKEIVSHDNKLYRVIHRDVNSFYCVPFSLRKKAIRRSKRTQLLFPKKECELIPTCIIPISEERYTHLLNAFMCGEQFVFRHELTKQYENAVDRDVVLFTCKERITIACEISAQKVLTYKTDIIKKKLRKVPMVRIVTFSYCLMP